MFLATDAIAVIELARERGIALLGIDGFHLLGEIVQPSLEDSIDYSRGKIPPNVHQLGIDFIRRYADQAEMRFEVVFADET